MKKQLKAAAIALLMTVAAVCGTVWAAGLEDEKALSARSIEMWGSGDFTLIDQTFDPEYLNHQEPDVEGGTRTLHLTAWRDLAGGFHKSFSDIKVEILLQVGESDLVATRWRFTATQTGTYLGLAPTGKTISWTGTQVDRFRDGKIAETWVNWDMYGMFEQLGLVK
ncbi:MAG: ester cyclase [Hyphomicrobiales bacterium]|nr:ester cyclase [Hyphomicrobiales bacterium]